MSEKPNVESEPASVEKPGDLTPEELEQISGGVPIGKGHEGWIEP